MKSDTSKMMKGAFLLTFAGLISKILSAGYRVPLQNLTGDTGFYIYQQVYPLLGMATVLALYGFPVAVSKITSERQAEGKKLSYQAFFGPISVILMGINGVIAVFLLLNANLIATWIGDENLVFTYQIAAFVFLTIPFTSLLRGVFQGKQDMTPTAISQIGEQFVRVGMIITAAYLISQNQWSLYHIGPAAGIAAIVGTLVALCILLVFLKRNKPEKSDGSAIPWGNYVKTILLFGLIASLNHMILLIIQFADTLSLVSSLENYGLTKELAREMKGVFDRGQPLIQVGAVLGSSFALALLPNLTRQKFAKQPGEVYQSIQRALIFSFYVSSGAMVGLLLIFPETNMLLFKTNEGTMSLRILAISVLLSALAITGTTILQGLGYLKRTAAFILIAFFIKWMANQLVVPLLGITGSAIATVISLLVLCSIVLFELKRKLPHLFMMQLLNGKAFTLANLGMIFYITFLKMLMPVMGSISRGTLLLWVLLMAITGGLIYIILLIRLKAFTREELSMLPFARMFIRLSKEE